MRKSFTLIELIVVIGIIAVLSGLGASAYNGFQQAARDSRRKNDLETITKALNAYYAVHGRFPPVGTNPYGTSWVYVYSHPEDPEWIDQLVPEFIEALPVDPINNANRPWLLDSTNYSYAYGNVSLDGQEYDLTARLENQADPDRCEVKQYKLHWTRVDWCGSHSPQIYEHSPNSL